jgi:hypothetical protein
LIGLNEAEFLSMHLEHKLIIIDLLKAIQIRDSFSFTPIGDLTGFQEHIGDQDISFIA